ncbi:hypothetical protein CsSME_00010018 [Camellia sinensis var. sinensis]
MSQAHVFHTRLRLASGFFSQKAKKLLKKPKSQQLIPKNQRFPFLSIFCTSFRKKPKVIPNILVFLTSHFSQKAKKLLKKHVPKRGLRRQETFSTFNDIIISAKNKHVIYI